MSNLPSLTFPLSFINDASSPIQRLIVDIVNQSKAVTVNNDCLWNDFCKDKSFLQKFREKNIRSNIPETLSNLLSEIDTNYDDTNIVAYHENEAWTFSFSARFRSLSILKSAALPVSVKASEPVVALVEKVVEVAAPSEPVAEVAAPVEPVVEVAAPVEPVAEVAAPVEPVVEVAAPVEPVAEVAAPVEPIVEVAAPVDPVAEVAAPVEPVVEVAAPSEPVAEVAAPVEPIVEVAAPAEPVAEVAAPASQ